MQIEASAVFVFPELKPAWGEEDRQTNQRQENWRYDLDVDSINACYKSELVEKALEGIEDLRCWTGHNIQGGIENQWDINLERGEYHNDLEVIQDEFEQNWRIHLDSFEFFHAHVRFHLVEIQDLLEDTVDT